MRQLLNEWLTAIALKKEAKYFSDLEVADEILGDAHCNLFFHEDGYGCTLIHGDENKQYKNWYVASLAIYDKVWSWKLKHYPHSNTLGIRHLKSFIEFEFVNGGFQDKKEADVFVVVRSIDKMDIYDIAEAWVAMIYGFYDVKNSEDRDKRDEIVTIIEPVYKYTRQF
jgi:hypothetical protein